MKILFVLDDAAFGDDVVAVAERAAPHVDMIWYRIKNTDADVIFDKSLSVRRQLTQMPLILSERADIAVAAGFDGVHLGARSLPIDVVKQSHPKLTVGYSAHSIGEIEELNADYFTLSPIFYTEKEYEVNPLGPVDVSGLGKPVYALGGVSADNVRQVMNCGFSGVAGIGFADELALIRSRLNGG